MEVQSLAALGMYVNISLVFPFLLNILLMSFMVITMQGLMKILLGTTLLGLKMSNSTFRWSSVITAYL